MMAMIKNTILYLKPFLLECMIMSVLMVIGCKKNQTSLCSTEIGLASQSDFPIGAAIDHILIQTDSSYREIAITQFNRITPENILKPNYIHPQENQFNFSEVDQLINYCRNNNLSIHGHTLVWHQQNPDWLNSFQGTRDDWDRLLKTHIQSIVRYYRPNILSWDVVNEAFNEDGTLRNNIWFQHLGSAYIEKAFVYAKEANPEAKLFYNEYGLESNPTKLKAVIQYFNSLRNRGIQIDGIGLQMHVSTAYSEISMIENAIQTISNNHYLLHLSELDISLNPLSKEYTLTQDDLNDQADLMYKIMRAYKNIPSELQFGITFWGISDQYSWIRSYYNRIDYPLLFDENYQPKPIYCKLKQSL